MSNLETSECQEVMILTYLSICLFTNLFRILYHRHKVYSFSVQLLVNLYLSNSSVIATIQMLGIRTDFTDRYIIRTSLVILTIH